MDLAILFSPRDVLAASVEAFGGTELGFVNVSEAEVLFRMQVSFSIPQPPELEPMLSISAVGQPALLEAVSQESACAAAIRVLQEEHKYIVLDYSLFRVWECKERFNAFVQKVQNGRSMLANVLSQSLEGFQRIQSTIEYFGRKIGSLRASGHAGTTRNSAAACAVQLEMIYAQAMQGHTSRAEQLDEINDPSDLNALMVAAGFNIPGNEAERIKLDGALEAILSRVATDLGYHPPEFGMKNQDTRFKCYIRFVSSDGGQARTFTGFGRICNDPVSARHTALYNCLLALSVNYRVLISDPNRGAYLFAKERVDELGSELVVLGNVGNNTCSSIEEVLRIVEEVIAGYSTPFGVHPVGQILLQKLHNLHSRILECLGTIGPLVRVLNQEALVGQIPY